MAPYTSNGKTIAIIHQQQKQQEEGDSSTVNTMSPRGWNPMLAAPLSASPVLRDASITPAWQLKILGNTYSEIPFTFGCGHYKLLKKKFLLSLLMGT